MFKILSAALVVGFLGVASPALAGGCGCSSGGTGATVATAPETTAQRSTSGQARRMYSYEPSMGASRGYGSPAMRGFGGAGVRGAGSKTLGNYGR